MAPREGVDKGALLLIDFPRTFVQKFDGGVKVRKPGELSNKQRRILEFIRGFLREHGLPPTVRDIQRACNISSTSVVDYNLHILQREGYIRRRPEVARGIELLGEEARTGGQFRVPVVGYIAAGQPLPVPTAEGWAPQEALETLELPSHLFRAGREVYALIVKGSSMIDALIDEGDIVLVEPVRRAENGDMVVAWLKSENEATLKRFYYEGERVRLQPANSQMEPIYVHPANVEVHGRVVGVIRLLR